jgi:predicted flap endonuclease-1-like 5' DNA nuclease
MTKKVSFRLPASHVAGAAQGILVGEFNNWNVEEGIWLQKQEDGSMMAELSLTAGKTYQYRYLLSDGRWVNDDNGKTFTEVFGAAVENCIIEVPLPEKRAVSKKAPASKATPAKKKMVSEDDFTKLEGINKKVASLLVANDIRQYKDLAKMSIRKLQLILDGAGSKFNVYNPATWPKQAKLAAAGKWEELTAQLPSSDPGNQP